MGGIAGGIDDIGLGDAESERHAQRASGHFERAAHHSSESGEQRFQLGQI